VPSSSSDVGAGWPQVIAATAGDADHLYAVAKRCEKCDPELRASSDGGRTWQGRWVPPGVTGPDAVPPRLAGHGADELSWVENPYVGLAELFRSYAGEGSMAPVSPAGEPKIWVSSDGGRTWRRADVVTDPVDAVGGDVRPFGCLPRTAGCRLSTVDVVRGRVAPLAYPPAGIVASSIQTGVVNAPAGRRLWLSGIDPTSRKPAVATSQDGGRTWSTHVFADGVAAGVPPGGVDEVAGKFVPMVAATAGGTAYALIFRDDTHQAAYRTTDGGRIWRPVPGAGAFGTPYWSYATADGRHVVVVMNDRAGIDLWASEGGRAYRRATVPGYPTAPPDPGVTPDHPVEGRYVEWTGLYVHLSEDGWRWRSIPLV
jgi:hypothetical protein